MSKSRKRGWKIVKFGDVVRNANLVERDPEKARIERIVGLEHLDPENLHIRRWNTPEDGTSFTREFVPGQTLFGKRRAYQRKVAFAEFKGICSGDILTFESKDPQVLLPELLPFLCQTDAFFDHALGTSAGSLSPRTSWSALKNFEFPLPPLAEQERIAEILWSADEAIEAFKVAHSQIDSLVGAIRRDITSLHSHQIVKLGPVIDRIFAGRSVVGKNEPATFGQKGVLKVSAVGKEGFVPNENKALLDESEFLPQYCVQANSLLITRCNTKELVGRVCLAEETYPDLMLCDKTLEIKLVSSKADKYFIYQMLKSSSVRKQIIGCATGTGGAMKNISQDDIRSLKLPLPGLKKQKAISAKLQKIQRQKGYLKKNMQTEQDVLKLYLSEMMERNSVRV